MSFTEVGTDKKSNQKWWALLLVFVVVGGLFIALFSCKRCWNPHEDEGLLIEGEGYQGRIYTDVLKVNRYTMTYLSDNGENQFQNPNGLVVPMPRPSLSATPTYDYIESFESIGYNWTSITSGSRKTNPVYQGAYSYKLSSSPSIATPIFTSTDSVFINENDTADVIFYAQTIQDFSGSSLFAFQFNVSVNATQYRITNVIYGTYIPGSNEIVLTSNITKKMWMGYLTMDIKDQLSLLVPEISTMNFTISNMGFILKSSGVQFVYLDYISIQSYPKEITSAWYYNSQLITDYQITINFTLRIDTEAITDENAIKLRFNIFLAIDGVIDIGEFLIDAITFTEMTFTDESVDIYDRVCNGSYTGILHRLPHDNSLGNNLLLDYNADINAYAPLISGQYASDSYIDPLLTDDFNVLWKNPIDVEPNV
jgi:hypothetical protein